MFTQEFIKKVEVEQALAETLEALGERDKFLAQLAVKIQSLRETLKSI